jgi:hypothetical protein
MNETGSACKILIGNMNETFHFQGGKMTLNKERRGFELDSPGLG